ncbi:hypothetical protein KM043_000829 [Ampulex compressa]|nr:hypothetical protein KM043_000829 [Ampulex compressa]
MPPTSRQLSWPVSFYSDRPSTIIRELRLDEMRLGFSFNDRPRTATIFRPTRNQRCTTDTPSMDEKQSSRFSREARTLALQIDVRDLDFSMVKREKKKDQKRARMPVSDKDRDRRTSSSRTSFLLDHEDSPLAWLTASV